MTIVQSWFGIFGFFLFLAAIGLIFKRKEEAKRKRLAEQETERLTRVAEQSIAKAQTINDEVLALARKIMAETIEKEARQGRFRWPVAQ